MLSDCIFCTHVIFKSNFETVKHKNKNKSGKTEHFENSEFLKSAEVIPVVGQMGYKLALYSTKFHLLLSSKWKANKRDNQ